MCCYVLSPGKQVDVARSARSGPVKCRTFAARGHWIAARGGALWMPQRGCCVAGGRLRWQVGLRQGGALRTRRVGVVCLSGGMQSLPDFGMFPKSSESCQMGYGLLLSNRCGHNLTHGWCSRARSGIIETHVVRARGMLSCPEVTTRLRAVGLAHSSDVVAFRGCEMPYATILRIAHGHARCFQADCFANC